MSRHFQYLFDDAENDFFQRVAANQVAPLPKMTEKVAAIAAPSRFDLDMMILAEAGECGMDFGMTKRACSYLESALDRPGMDTQTFVDLFEKVAAVAIERDMAGVERYLVNLASANGHDEEMAKAAAAVVGRDLALATIATCDELLKMAGLGSLFGKAVNLPGKALGLGRAAVSATKSGLATASGAIGGVARRTGSAVAGTARADLADIKSVASRGLKKYREVRVGGAESAVQQSQKALGRKRIKMESAAPGGIMQEAHRKGLASLEKTHDSNLQNLGKRQTALENHGKPKAPKPTTTDAPSPTVTTKTDVDAPKTDAGGVPPPATVATKREIDVPATKAVDDAAPKKDLDITDNAGADKAVGAASEATLGGSWKKFQSGGWKSLSDTEKRKLITAGVVSAAGYRLATGRDPISGS